MISLCNGMDINYEKHMITEETDIPVLMVNNQLTYCSSCLSQHPTISHVRKAISRYKIQELLEELSGSGRKEMDRLYFGSGSSYRPTSDDFLLPFLVSVYAQCEIKTLNDFVKKFLRPIRIFFFPHLNHRQMYLFLLQLLPQNFKLYIF